MHLVKSIKKKFRPTYIKLYEFLTLKLLAFVSTMVRKLIILKDKDPDYISPPSPPPIEIIKERPKFYIPYVPSWVAVSFSDKTKHPLYRGRKVSALETTIEETALQVSEPVAEVSSEELFPSL